MEHLTALQNEAAALEPAPAVREALLEQVLAHTQRFLNHLDRAPSFSGNERPALDRAPIGEQGEPLEHLLSLLQQNVDGLGLNPASPGYLGYIPGGGLFHAALGDYMAAVTNRYAGVYFAGPGAVQMENLLLAWMAEVVGYPATSAGNLSSGGSLANLTAIVTAREAGGVLGAEVERAVLYTTSHAHHCIDKALRIAGLAACPRRTVAVDDHYRMDAASLAQSIAADRAAGLRPWLVVASAGTTNSGAVDPLSDIADIAAAEGLWYHVDGAYGGLFALCPEGRAVLGGMDRSDSVVLDPHKTLFLPYGTGAVLVRDRRALYTAFGAEADYMQNILDEVGELSPSDLSPELTKHFRGLRLWLPLKLLGVAPFRAALSEKIHLARYAHERLQSLDGFEVGPYPDLSVVTYRYVPPRGNADEFNERLRLAIQEDGRVFVSGTRLDGKQVLRAAILCFRTHRHQIDTLLEVLEEKACELAET